MPYELRKSPKGGVDIIRKDTGKKVGHSDSLAKAQASVRARYAGENKANKSKPKGK